MSRKYIAAGNWKMHTTPTEGVELAIAIQEKLSPGTVKVIVAPPATHLQALLEAIGDGEVKIAAQNCHFESKGAFTGEIAPPMLAAMGIPYVIIGHSERREYFHENNSIVRKKVSAVLDAGMECIFCCGEPLNIRENGTQGVYVNRQVEQGLFSPDRSPVQQSGYCV